MSAGPSVPPHSLVVGNEPLLEAVIETITVCRRFRAFLQRAPRGRRVADQLFDLACMVDKMNHELDAGTPRS